MSTAELLWGCFILAGAAAMAGYTVLTQTRGWAKDEDGEIHQRDDRPRAFLFTQLLQVASVAVLVYVGVRALDGWK
jgi:predicted RNA-binding protein